MHNAYRIPVTMLAALALAGCNGAPNISFENPPMYSVGGTISGVAGSGLQLANNGNAFLVSPEANGLNPSLAGVGAPGTSYDLTVVTQPGNPSQTCIVANGMGTIGNANSTAITVTCTTHSSQFLYASSEGFGLTGTIEPFSINAGSGALTAVPGAALSVSGTPYVVAVTPSGQFAYVLGISGAVSAYTIGNSGALTAIAGSPYPTDNQSSGLTIDPSGTYLYVTNSTDPAVFAFTVGSSGALTAVAGSPFATGTNPLGVATVITTASQRFVYVTNGALNNVSAYLAASTNGALTSVAGSPFAAGNDPNSITVDPTAQFVFVTNASDNTVSAYTIDSQTGVLTAVNGSPFATGAGPIGVAADPSGPYVYVANLIDGTVSAYSIDSQTGALSVVAGSPFAAGNQPYSAQVDNLGHYLYVANLGSSNISAYAIGADGALTALASSPVAVTGGNGPTSVATAN